VTLGEKQELFTEFLARLIAWSYARGYRIRIGEVYRPPETAAAMAASGKGIKNSLHILKLAADLHLFKDGVFLVDSEAHRPLGEFWKSLHTEARWGGDFARRDGNHYSITHNGVA
jgi:hypothetical protein